MSDETFRTQNRRLPLQLVLVPGGRPGGHGPHQVRRQRAHHPRDVQRAGRSDVRPQGPVAGRRRRDDRRLPSGRVPLHRAELQGHAPLRHAAAHAPGRWASSPTASSWSCRIALVAVCCSNPSASCWSRSCNFLSFASSRSKDSARSRLRASNSWRSSAIVCACSASDVFIRGRRGFAFVLSEPFLVVVAIKHQVGDHRQRN